MVSKANIEMGVCPVCGGSRVVEVPPERLRWQGMNALRVDDTHEQCRNCGGQTMSLHATGKVRLRPDSTPCKHEYEHASGGNCWHIYTCKHCGDRYDIDSSD